MKTPRLVISGIVILEIAAILVILNPPPQYEVYKGGKNDINETQGINHPEELLVLNRSLMTYTLKPDIRTWINLGLNAKSLEKEHIPGYIVRTNEQGYRDDEFKRDDNKTLTILIAGDSLSFGWGVNRSERYSAVLERRLEARGRDVRVLNAAVPVHGIRDYYLVSKRLGKKYRPDIIIIGVNTNDVLGIKTKMKIYRDAKRSLDENRSDYQTALRRKQLNLRRERYYSKDLGDTHMDLFLNRIVNVSRSIEAKTVFLGIRPGTKTARYVKEWTEREKQEMIFYVPSSSRFKKTETEVYRLTEFDPHFNEVGHRWLAESIINSRALTRSGK